MIMYELELPLVDTPAQDTLPQQFAAYDAKNPEVSQAFSALVLTRIKSGYISPRDLAPEVRSLVGHGVNNSYWHFLADKFKAQYPHLAYLFREHRRPEGAMALHYKERRR